LHDGEDQALVFVGFGGDVRDQHLQDHVQVALEHVNEQEWVERLDLEYLLEHACHV